VKDKLARRQDFVGTLHDFGIFLMQRNIYFISINDQHFLRQQQIMMQNIVYNSDF